MAEVRKNVKVFVVLAVLLCVGVPLSFDIIARILGKDKINMPVYYEGDKKIKSHEAWKMAGQGQLKPVSELNAVNQFGDHVSLNNDLKGRLLVINFFFTSCPDVCPKLTNNIKMLENAFRRSPMSRNDTIVQFISISVDPARDSVDALQAYAKRFGVDQNRWWFLTGDKHALYDYARNQLHVFAPQGDGGADDFIHTEQVVILDRDRFIRGHYNGLDSLDLAYCVKDLGLLAMEKKK